MHGAVHRLQVIVNALLANVPRSVVLGIELHRRVHPLRVPVEVLGLLEKCALGDVRSVDELVPGLVVALARVVLHDTANDTAPRVEHCETGTDLIGEREEVKFRAKPAVIATLSFLQKSQVRLQVVLGWPGGAVDALELLILLIAQPVGRGGSH